MRSGLDQLSQPRGTAPLAALRLAFVCSCRYLHDCGWGLHATLAVPFLAIPRYYTHQNPTSDDASRNMTEPRRRLNSRRLHKGRRLRRIQNGLRSASPRAPLCLQHGISPRAHRVILPRFSRASTTPISLPANTAPLKQTWHYSIHTPYADPGGSSRAAFAIYPPARRVKLAIHEPKRTASTARSGPGVPRKLNQSHTLLGPCYLHGNVLRNSSPVGD